MRRLFTAALIGWGLQISVGSASQAAGIRVEGTLLDRYTGEPLSNVTFALGTKKGTTDAAGRFLMDDSPTGTGPN